MTYEAADTPARPRQPRRPGRIAILGRVLGLIHHLTMPALPAEPMHPPPPPIADVADPPGERPRRRGTQQNEAMLEHFGHLAETARNERAAAAALSQMIPYFLALLGGQGGVGARAAAPTVARAVRGAGRMMRRSPDARPLVATLPVVLRRTANNVRRRAASHRATRTDVLRELRMAFDRTLANPQTADTIARRVHAHRCPVCGTSSRGVIRKFVATAGGVTARVRGAHGPGCTCGMCRCGCRHFGP